MISFRNKPQKYDFLFIFFREDSCFLSYVENIIMN